MRKFLPFLFAAALASSCIDNAYDLSNVNTDDVTGLGIPAAAGHGIRKYE